MCWLELHSLPKELLPLGGLFVCGVNDVTRGSLFSRLGIFWKFGCCAPKILRSTTPLNNFEIGLGHFPLSHFQAKSLSLSRFGFIRRVCRWKFSANIPLTTWTAHTDTNTETGSWTTQRQQKQRRTVAECRWVGVRVWHNVQGIFLSLSLFLFCLLHGV